MTNIATTIANRDEMINLSNNMDNVLEVIEETMAEAKMFLDEGLPASAELCLVRVEQLQEQFRLYVQEQSRLYENFFNRLDEETHQLIEAEEEEELLPF